MIGEMWAGFSRVAAANPYAWRRESYTAEEITTPTAENRMVSFPYTKRMVSNPDVDMSSGLIVCSAARAAELGIPDGPVGVPARRDRRDRPEDVRADRLRVLGVDRCGRSPCAGAGLAPRSTRSPTWTCTRASPPRSSWRCVSSTSRSIASSRSTAACPSPAAPGTTPSGHALASMVDVLREDAGSLGLVTANGGIVDKHAFGVFSTAPPEGGFRYECPQDAIDARGGRDGRRRPPWRRRRSRRGP